MGQVAPISEIHDNAQVALLGLVDFAESDDVGVLEDFEDLRFFEGLCFLLLAHTGDVYLLDDAVGLVRLALNEEGLAESSFAE